MLGSCLPHSGYVITACARSSLNQLIKPPWYSVLLKAELHAKF
jgi:hypothetical protein